ncbi:methyltransferase domain-containing protein [Kaistella sp. G5-32]|uniref:Methyltransferase domain-containing protein n=1 Tax=Kaistella gelatinilytica TaxID=2787636 RepID=A0ABS0FAB9_9FLAO|nr:class I SAM-dependent methyltransferase [Kaistella gelatinilytica]MBF8456617.1 methyltransferase domain-containing protein [Kaistella gelatinilytica]
MDKYNETFETWNKIALQYEEKFMDMNLYNDTYDLICTSLPEPNSKILEIGCGPGNITKYLLSKRPDFDIFGIDIASNMIELAKKNNPKANFKVMDCREIDQLKTKFDAIVCGFCLPYLSQTDSVKLIFDCSNLLNKSGLIYLSFVEGNPSRSDFQTSGSGHRSYFYYHEFENLKDILLENKFDEIQTFKVNYKKSEHETEIHTIVIAKKKAIE